MKDSHIEKTGVISDDEKIIVNIEGKDVECNVLFTFEADNSDNVYIGYTDNKLAQDGKTRIFVGRYNKDLGPSHIEPIETEEEYNMVYDVIAKIQSES